MHRKKMIKETLVVSLFFLALGGWLLHLRIHPPQTEAYHLVPFVAGIGSVFFVPLLFCFRPTLAVAYIINGFLVIIGTITMAHFSIVHFQGSITPVNIILKTTFADIAILWGKFAVGQALFNLEFLKSETDALGKGRYFRYPNMGWWWVHLFALTAVYALGNIFWK